MQASLSSASRGGTPRSRTYARPPIPRTNSNIDDGDAASVAESDDISIATEDDFRVDCGQEGESVQVSTLTWQPPANTCTAPSESQQHG